MTSVSTRRFGELCLASVWVVYSFAIWLIRVKIDTYHCAGGWLGFREWSELNARGLAIMKWYEESTYPDVGEKS